MTNCETWFRVRRCARLESYQACHCHRLREHPQHRTARQRRITCHEEPISHCKARLCSHNASLGLVGNTPCKPHLACPSLTATTILYRWRSENYKQHRDCGGRGNYTRKQRRVEQHAQGMYSASAQVFLSRFTRSKITGVVCRK